MLQAVLFDRDGVLLDSETIHLRSTLFALERCGITPEPSDAALIVGRHPSEYITDFIRKYHEHPISPDAFRSYQKGFYYEHIDQAPLFEDALQLVKSLHASKIPLGLVTSSSRDNTVRFLARTGLGDYFAAITAFEDCDKRKPEPDPYLLTAAKMRVDPKQCIAIEDTALGVESAKRAGMMCIAIPNEHTRDQDFSKADMVVASAKDLTPSFLDALL